MATQPGNPTNLSLSYSSGTATLTFNAPSNTGGSAIVFYVVFLAADTGFTTALFDNGGGTGTSITMAGLTPGSSTNYVLVSQNDGYGYSTGVGFVTNVPNATQPGNPTNLSLSYSGTTGTLTFTTPDNTGAAPIVFYVVFAASDTGFTTALFDNGGGTGTSITMAGLAVGSTNYVLVSQNDGYAGYSTGVPFTAVVSGGGGAGDPYVTTFSNISYKLPTMDAPIRYFQTMEGGKLLTVNAQLKTVERSAMSDDTLRSLIVLKKKMTTKQYAVIAAKLMKPELLCFFERVSVQHGDQRLVVNLWDSKFDLVENTLRCVAEKVDRADLLKTSGGIYDGYAPDTIKLTIGSTAVYLSTYASPLVRNGIYVESAALKGANGVVVNALSPGAMTLPSLASVEPVATRDSLKAVTKVETFVDHDGLRSRNIVTYK